jgi:hypothetical protein
MNYEAMVSNALRGVMIEALEIAVKGLPGDHHFFIEFDTRYAGVHLSEQLSAQYPEAMTIVLQHQYWDLTVSRDEFSVGLAFGGIRNSLTVPFGSVISFADPSVNFALQFEAEKPAAPAPVPVAVETISEAGDSASDEGAEKVVTLDAFRKK